MEQEQRYLVVKKIGGEPGQYPILDEIFTADEYRLSEETIKYLASHGHIVTYHEGM